jgi:HAD superfamily hydrolase (TIGR01549 family)
MPHAIRALLFDAGNTLLQMNYVAIADELARGGVRVTPEEVQRAEWRARVRLDDEVLARYGPADSTESRSTGDRYLGFVLDGLGVTDMAMLERMGEWRRTYNRPGGVWNTAEPQAHDALNLVKRAGVRAAVISNSNGSVRAILEMLGLTDDLDFVIDSGEVGVEKPDPRIFELALARAGVTAAEAAYVGDLYSIDVRGARAAGIRAILLDPAGHWGTRDCDTAPDVVSAVRLALTWR